MASQEDSRLTGLANFPDYSPDQRIVAPDGLVTAPEVVMKWYNMFTEGQKEIPAERVAAAKDFLGRQIVRDQIGKFSGLGFAILSDEGEMLNVGIWDQKTPILLKNTVYEHEREIDLRNEGAFCAWELAIAAHEARAWRTYLASAKSDADKRAYLDDQIRGKL